MKKEIEFKFSAQAQTIIDNLKNFDENDFLDFYEQNIKNIGDSFISKYLILKKAKEEVEAKNKNKIEVV